MPSTYNFYNGGLGNMRPQRITTPRGFKGFILRNVIDTTQQNLGADADIIQAILVPAEVTVMGVTFKVTTVDAGASALSLGITGVDTTKWGSGIATTTAGSITPTGGPPFNPHYFAAADTIDILSNGGAVITTLVAEIIAVCVDSNTTIDAGGN